MDQDSVLQQKFAAFKTLDQKAVSYFYRLHWRPLLFFIWNKVRNLPEAEDIGIQSFKKLLDQIEIIETPDHLRDLLYKIADRMALNFIRKQKREQGRYRNFRQHLTIEQNYSSESEEANAFLLREINLLKENLPPKCKEVLRLLEQGMDYAQIANKLGVDINTVRGHKHQAKEKLKDLLRKRGFLTLFLSALYAFSKIY